MVLYAVIMKDDYFNYLWHMKKQQQVQWNYTSLPTHCLSNCLWKFQHQNYRHIKTKVVNIKSSLHDWEINITDENCFNYLWHTYQFYEMFFRAEIGSLISYFSTHPRKKTSRLTIHALSFQSSLCHCFLDFVDPRKSWPSSTIPSSSQETHHFLQSYLDMSVSYQSVCLPIIWNRIFQKYYSSLIT
jgi:hypothetical protein